MFPEVGLANWKTGTCIEVEPIVLLIAGRCVMRADVPIRSFQLTSRSTFSLPTLSMCPTAEQIDSSSFQCPV